MNDAPPPPNGYPPPAPTVTVMSAGLGRCDVTIRDIPRDLLIGIAQGILRAAGAHSGVPQVLSDALLPGLTLGERIRRRRREVGLHQQALADVMGVSRSAVAQWETDRTALTMDNLRKLTAALQLEVQQLVG